MSSLNVFGSCNHVNVQGDADQHKISVIRGKKLDRLNSGVNHVVYAGAPCGLTRRQEPIT